MAVFPGGPGRNVSILDIVGANDDEDDGHNWWYETYKAPVKSLRTTNQHLTFLEADALPVTQPTVSKDEG